LFLQGFFVFRNWSFLLLLRYKKATAYLCGMNNEYTISKAGLPDVPQLVALINSAYRGESAKKGWTHEADLIDGTVRTDNESLIELMEGKNAQILKCTGENDAIVGCVYLEKQGDQLYLGMLSVSPLLQAAGIGKKLLQAADCAAEKLGCKSIYMHVIPVRQELIAWYNRNGYTDTGERKPFPDTTRYGTPRQPLEFCVLQKSIAQTA